MRRAGVWCLILLVVASMAGGAWLAFRRVRNRETLGIAYLVSPTARPPSSDAMISGAQFAVNEFSSKAGGYRIDFFVPDGRGSRAYQVWMGVHDRHLLQGSISAGLRPLPTSGTPPPEPVVRVLPGLDDQGRAAADWVGQAGTRRVVILCDDATPASVAIRDAFRHRAEEIGLPVPNSLDTAMERQALLDRVLQDGPDLVFYSGETAPYSTAFDLFEALRKKGYRGKLAMGDADPEVSFLAVSTRVVEGTFLISTIEPPSKEFAALYEPATQRLAGPHAWPGYLTMKALLVLIDRTGSNKPDDLYRAAIARPPELRPCALYQFKEGRFGFLRNLK